MKENIKKGRPYLTGKPKNIKTTVLLDEDEYQELKTQAQKNNMGIAEYIRYLIFKNQK